MNLEIERKFRLTDVGQFRNRLKEMGIELRQPELQTDQYFAHPTRDFAVTDEALRVRFSNHRCAMTYKGPKLDAHTKSRAEIELPFDLSLQTPAPIAELLEQLGFRSVAKVVKHRHTAIVHRQGQEISIDLDEVEGLGAFVELEVVCDSRQAEAARSAVGQLASELELHDDIRASYLELLLHAESTAAGRNPGSASNS